jgi:competence protein ComEC
MLAGYDWAAYRAHDRLSRALPLALEGRDVRITGRVEGLPVRSDDGVRFLFRVDQFLSPVPKGEDRARFNATFAALLRLSWSTGRTWKSAAAPVHVPEVAPGQRLTLTVRLKRPHANANFGGPDFEAWMLQRGIRATGYVRAASAVLEPPGKPQAEQNAEPNDETQAKRQGETQAETQAATQAETQAATQAETQAETWLHPSRPYWQDAIFDLRQGAERYRAKIAGRIDAVLPQAAHGGVVKALSIGDQGAIAKADWERFARTGTNHLVAISGLHVGLVAGFAAWLGGGLWRSTARTRWPLPLWIPAPRVAASCGLIAAALFVALAGFGIPAQRAFWMLAAVFLTMISGRSAAPSSLWCTALFLVVAVDPWSPTSAGFWLSFGAVGAILYALNGHGKAVQAPDDEASPQATHAAHLPQKPLKGLARQPASRWVRTLRAAWVPVRPALAGAVRAQFAVTIALIPATLGWFGQVPLLGPLANAFAIPWVSFLVVPAVLTGVLVPAPFDAYAFMAAHHLIAWLGHVLEVFAAPQWALVRLPQPNAWTMCAAVVGLAVWLGPKGLPLQPFAPLLCLPLLLPRPPSLAPGDFRVTMMDIGQGNAAVVETRDFRLIYDTGPPIGHSDAGARIILPALRAQGIDRLDALVVSHNHDDHYGGAASLLKDVPVRHFLASLPPKQPLWAAAHRAGARTQRCQQGQSWRWNDVRFDVLWPPDPGASAPPNTMSCVIRVSNGHHVALLTGDIEAAQEAALVRSGLPLAAQVLMAPHHGSSTSSTSTFLDAVKPQHVVFQMGYRNRHRHPNAKVVARYAARGTRMYRNDQDGAVRFVSAGVKAMRDARRGEQRWAQGNADADAAASASAQSEPVSFEVDAFRRTHRRYWMGE